MKQYFRLYRENWYGNEMELVAIATDPKKIMEFAKKQKFKGKNVRTLFNVYLVVLDFDKGEETEELYTDFVLVNK